MMQQASLKNTNQSEVVIPSLTVCGDMLGDRCVIKDSHVARARNIVADIEPRLKGKDVLAVGGDSGAGKSEVAALVGTLLNNSHRGVYVLSCDNYPHLPPTQNDARRTELFESGGRAALEAYLGSQAEIDFARLANIISAFKSGQGEIPLRIMNTTAGSHRVEDDARMIDFSKIDVLIMEGTWSHLVNGTDFKFFLQPPPGGTRAHRAERGRDALNDFIENVVLPIEREKLKVLATKASHVVSSEGVIRKQFS